MNVVDYIREIRSLRFSSDSFASRHCCCCLLMGLMLPVLSLGCGESRVPVFPVTGKVTFDGEPPVGAQIVFHPSGHTLPEDEAATGTVKDGGNFDVNIYGTGGVPAGDYVATVQWRKLVQSDGGYGTGPNVIPEKYGSAKTSPLKVTVKPEPTELPPIVIEK